MKKSDFKIDPRVHLDTPYEDEDIIVQFVGDHAFDYYTELGQHTNPGYEICLILYGKGVFRINDVSYHVVKNQLFITKEPQHHSGWPANENPFRLLYICFRIKSTSRSNIWKSIDAQLKKIGSPVSYDKYAMAEVHHMLIREIINSGYLTNDVVCGLIRYFIVLAVRNYTKISSSDENHKLSDKPADKKSRLINRIMYSIEDHLDKKPDLSTIGAAYHYSPSYISRLFKQHTGFTIMEYYNYARLEHAKQLLLTEDESISNIAEKFGYSSIHHFSSSFRAFYGLSPMQYKKKQMKIDS